MLDNRLLQDLPIVPRATSYLGNVRNLFLSDGRRLTGPFYSFIGQLTIARFRGDTTFGLVARIIATFFGGLLGTVLW